MPSLYDKTETTLAALGVKGGNPRAVVEMVEQGGIGWLKARLGLPTASYAKCIVTSKGDPCKGETRNSYLLKLAIERVTGRAENEHETDAMRRGTALEPKARAYYVWESGNEVLTSYKKPHTDGLFHRVGFVYRDDERRCGCSPDGLCVDRMIECKCLLNKNHVKAMMSGKPLTAHIPQMQMQLWVCGMSVCDYVLYTPPVYDAIHQLPSAVFTVEADDKFQAALTEHVAKFTAEIDAAEARIRGMA